MSEARFHSPQPRYGKLSAYAPCLKLPDKNSGRYEKPVGLVITLYVYLAYVIALKFEGCVSQLILGP